MGPFTYLVESAVPASVAEPFVMVRILVMVVLSRPLVKVSVFDTLIGVFRVRPLLLLSIKRVNTGVALPAVALIACVLLPAKKAVPVPEPNVMAEAEGDVTVTLPL